MRGRSRVDVVVVGRGAAGLAATKTARASGLDVLTLEAMDRIGGRAFTTSRPFGFPWDAGCHWLHSAGINPFTRYADELGFHYVSKSSPWHGWMNGRPTKSDEELEIDAYVDAVLAAAMRCGDEGIDIAVAEVMDHDNPWLDILCYQINAEWGVDSRAASTLDLVRYRDTGENWPLPGGYGALVAAVAGDASSDVELSNPVASIDWSGSVVRVGTASGSIEADAVIVTASTGVLADAAIRFDPPLPVWKLEAIAATPLGRANKIAVELNPSMLEDLPEQNISVPIGSGQMIGLRLRPYGRNLVDGYLGGPACTELEAAGEAAMLDVMVDAIETVLGSGVRRSVGATAASRWASEPYIRGAYAAAKPGQAHLRADLGRPIDNKLFFAGEATSPHFFTTCHGAWSSGEAAAADVAELRRRAASKT